MEMSADRGMPPVFMTPEDHRRLQALIDTLADTPVAERLGEEVERAVIVTGGFARRFVRLGSSVEIETAPSGRRRTVRLTLPGESENDPAALSILSPAGVALIGLKEGDEISWSDAYGRAQTLRVLKVSSDEAREENGDDGHDDGPCAA